MSVEEEVEEDVEDEMDYEEVPEFGGVEREIEITQEASVPDEDAGASLKQGKSQTRVEPLLITFPCPSSEKIIASLCLAF